MIDIITPKHRHLLWKDECGDDFLLFEWGTVYKYSEKVLGLNVFVRDVCRRMLSKGLIFEHIKLDDGFDMGYAKLEKLPDLLATSTWSKRLKIKGKRLREFERRLGHKIYPHRPKKFTGR